MLCFWRSEVAWRNYRLCLEVSGDIVYSSEAYRTVSTTTSFSLRHNKYHHLYDIYTFNSSNAKLENYSMHAQYTLNTLIIRYIH